jgi:hypothetical protein
VPTRYKTDEERRQARLAAWSKYNRSTKGSQRYKRYEEAHPERAQRWSPIMEIRARKLP